MAHRWKCLLCSFLCFFFLSKLLWQPNSVHRECDNNAVYQTMRSTKQWIANGIHISKLICETCAVKTPRAVVEDLSFCVSFKEFQSRMGRRIATRKAYIQVNGEYFIIHFYEYTLKWIIFMLRLLDWELTCGRLKPAKCEIPRIWVDSGDWVPNQTLFV